jgi:O-antigen ligase
MAAGLAGATLVLLGGAAIRRKLVIVLVLALAVVLFRPGVYRMVVHDAEATADTDSFKGGTFRYRLELWKVAWAEISASPQRLLFGCGPGCGLNSTVDWHLSYRGGREEEIWSWDNQLAYDLYQSGLLGLAASLTLYGSLPFALFRFWRDADSPAKPIIACLLASALAYEFMLTNVLMFTKPVNFLFWTIAAISYAVGRNPQSQELEILEGPDFVETEPSSFEPQVSHSIRRW